MMKKFLLVLFIGLTACNSNEKKIERISFTQVEVEAIPLDSISVRAIEIMGSSLAFAGSDGYFGFYNSADKKVKLNRQEHDSIYPEFRAVASTSNDFFMLSVANPALLYKTGDTGSMELVYMEQNEKVFYDSMAFWNDLEGIAMGDPTDNCLSIIITRDGGKSWNKISCDLLPETVEGEAAFAASDSNIAIYKDKVWIITGGMASRIFFSEDKGETWEVYDTPLVSGQPTTGGYSVHFYDEMNGIIFGGDYTKPEGNTGNKAVTRDGGRTWNLVADGKDPGYKSSVHYVPGGEAQEIVAVGFTGIHFSEDAGLSWKKLSDEEFYTIRFLDDSTAYAAGMNRLAKLIFR